jgi:hypothetical protein
MAENASGKAPRGERLAEAREHKPEARASMRRGIEDFIPRGFIEHGMAARKEMLMAMRSLLDAAIERTEKRGSAPK